MNRLEAICRIAPRGILCCAVLFVCSPAFPESAPPIGDLQPDATITLSVGDKAITGTRTAPYQVAWHGTAYPENGDLIDGGIWVTQLRRATLEGRDVLVRTAGALLFKRGTYNYLGAVAFKSIVDPQSLAPVSSEQHLPDGSSEKWAFDGKHVEWTKKDGAPQSQETVQKFDVRIAAFDISGAMLWFYFPLKSLKPGYSGVIPVVGDPDHPLRSLPFRVVRSERVKAGARGIVDTVVVECPDPTTGTARFWFNENIPFPVRMDIPATPGVPRTVYELAG